MASDRSAGRNVHIYDARDPDVVLGGLTLTNGVTNANFYSMVETFCGLPKITFCDMEMAQRFKEMSRRFDQEISTLSRMVGFCMFTPESGWVLISNRYHHCQ